MNKKTLPTFLFFSFLLINFSLAANWIAGSSYTYNFPLCKSLNVKISSSYPINLTIPEIEVYPNCTLIKNDTFNLEFDCKCYDGYVLNIKPYAFANNTYDILISYTYEQNVPEKIVKKKENLILKVEKPTINQTIINRTIIQPTEIKTVYVNVTNESLIEEINTLKSNLTFYLNLTKNLEKRSLKLKEEIAKVRDINFVTGFIVGLISIGVPSFLFHKLRNRGSKSEKRKEKI